LNHARWGLAEAGFALEKCPPPPDQIDQGIPLRGFKFDGSCAVREGAWGLRQIQFSNEVTKALQKLFDFVLTLAFTDFRSGVLEGYEQFTSAQLQGVEKIAFH
jgi:hypothetical protein